VSVRCCVLQTASHTHDGQRGAGAAHLDCTCQLKLSCSTAGQSQQVTASVSRCSSPGPVRVCKYCYCIKHVAVYDATQQTCLSARLLTCPLTSRTLPSHAWSPCAARYDCPEPGHDAWWQPALPEDSSIRSLWPRRRRCAACRVTTVALTIAFAVSPFSSWFDLTDVCAASSRCISLLLSFVGTQTSHGRL